MGGNVLTIVLIVIIAILGALVINLYANMHRLGRRYRMMMRGSEIFLFIDVTSITLVHSSVCKHT